jgi:hypothetical protein
LHLFFSCCYYFWRTLQGWHQWLSLSPYSQHITQKCLNWYTTSKLKLLLTCKTQESKYQQKLHKFLT